MTLKEAFSLVEEGSYKEAFRVFAKIYNESGEEELRRELMQTLKEIFYFLNEGELRGQYEKNIKALEGYSFVLGESFRKFEELPFLLFPVSEEIFYLYDACGDCFAGEYEAKTRNQMRYFFEDLDRPLFVEDEDNFYNLMFLEDNVRRSEDWGGDNHIYLSYRNLAPLERLLSVCDIEPLLGNQKFVFLLGEEAGERYPLDFKAEYGLEYPEGAAPLRPEELKRICYWYKHAYSGTDLSLQVFDTFSFTQVFKAHDFYYYSEVEGEQPLSPRKFGRLREILAEPMREYSLREIEELLNDPKNQIAIPRIKEAVAWARDTWRERDSYCVKDLFSLYFLFRYREKETKGRIVPLLVFDPHIWECDVHNALIQSFPYYTVLTCVREPIMTVARSYMYGLMGWNEFQTKYILASEYTHTQFLGKEMLRFYYGYRFEDLKARPKETLEKVCRVLNIPFEEAVLAVDAPVTDRNTGDTVHGFDNAPLHRDISSVFSEFDQIRLKMFYAPIHEYYGYPSFSFKEHKLPEILVRDLLSYPFRFEEGNERRFPNVKGSVLHGWLQEVLQGCLNRRPVMPKLI